MAKKLHTSLVPRNQWFLETKIISIADGYKDFKYNTGTIGKKYYEDHKEEIKKKGLEYLKKLKEENPEKIKEYRRNAYLKQKEKNEKSYLNSVKKDTIKIMKVKKELDNRIDLFFSNYTQTQDILYKT